MAESCPVCDTLWCLYRQPIDNLHELVGKHTETRDKGDQNSGGVLSHEIAIAESSLIAACREFRQQEKARHANQQEQP